MDKSNLFARLEDYAQENFVTETLAYILQSDHKARRKFLKLLLERQPKMLRSFGDYHVDTQVSYDIRPRGIGLIDLQLASKRDTVSKKIFVEVKTQSQEGEGQIEKYLKLRGHVAFLTPLGSDSPAIRHHADKFLGHFFWPNVYSAIERAGSKNVLHKQFLEYLEARHMGPSKPITKEERRAAVHAVGFITKSFELVDKIREQVRRDWREKFGRNTGARDVSDGLATGELPYWWYRTRGWKGEAAKFYLCIGIGFRESAHREPMFYLGVGSPSKRFSRRLESELARKFQLLRKRGWKRYPASDNDWGYRKFFPLGRGEIDSMARRQAQNVRNGIKDLDSLRIINSIKKRI